jgi:hypothetical protein
MRISLNADSISITQLRALEKRRVTLRTPSGELTGHVAQASIPDAALMVMFALDTTPETLVVLAIGDILEVMER